MRLLFIILAHDQPSQCFQLASTLVESSSDANVLIHYDKKATEADFAQIQNLCASHNRVKLVEKRELCVWGTYSLVQAVFNTLDEAQALKISFDYVCLLSGACLPTQPLSNLEKFLSENDGREFIEIEDKNWGGGGLRDDRYNLYHPLPPQKYKLIERVLVNLQRAFKIKRHAPLDMDIKFGSQWWVLRWETCLKCSNIISEKPALMSYFKKCWIPDEIVMPTLVNYLSDQDKHAGYNLTYYLFNKLGRPIIFYDDHKKFTEIIDSFFIRKISSNALNLREQILNDVSKIIGNADSNIDTIKAGKINFELQSHIRAQHKRVIPNQLFYRSQYSDSSQEILKSYDKPYVVCLCPDGQNTLLDKFFDGVIFEKFGNLFAKSSIDFGEGKQEYHGINQTALHIRDESPENFLMRVFGRTKKVPVFQWSGGDNKSILDSLYNDDNALVICLLPDIISHPALENLHVRVLYYLLPKKIRETVNVSSENLLDTLEYIWFDKFKYPPIFDKVLPSFADKNFIFLFHSENKICNSKNLVRELEAEKKFGGMQRKEQLTELTILDSITKNMMQSK